MGAHRPRFPIRGNFLHRPRLRSREVVQLRAVFGKIIKFPRRGATDAHELHIAHAHGGSLNYADRPGGGAVFTLTLPLSSDTPGNLA